MPFYDFKCPACDHIVTEFLSMLETNKVIRCKRVYCDSAVMKRNYQTEHIQANMDYHKPHISDSLAIHPDQTAEHKQVYPDVGVLPDGRIQFDSPKIHDNYLKKRGMFKHPQKKRLLTAK